MLLFSEAQGAVTCERTLSVLGLALQDSFLPGDPLRSPGSLLQKRSPPPPSTQGTPSCVLLAAGFEFVLPLICLHFDLRATLRLSCPCVRARERESAVSQSVPRAEEARKGAVRWPPYPAP